MISVLNDITENYSMIFFVRQLITVLALYAVGFFSVYCVAYSKKWGTIKRIYCFLLAFPVGIALYTISGLFLLITNIRYCAFTVIVLMVVEIMAIFAVYRPAGISDFSRNDLIGMLVVVVIATISVSGIISVGFSNDSMYYYYAYPHEIARSGFLNFKFDTFLTDAGQGTAVINSIPFLFGFNESFGIMNFFNINFLCFYTYAVFEQAIKLFNKKKALVFCILSLLVLSTTMPFVIISKWALANVFFMETMFIVLYLNYQFRNEGNNILVIRSILILTLSFLRIEGALFAGFVLLIYLMLDDAKKKDVIIPAIPVIIMQAGYFFRIYFTMDLLATYTFMSKGKAFIAVAFLVMAICYSLFYTDAPVTEFFKNKLTIFSPVPLTFVGLILVNIVLFLYDRGLFISNVKTFFRNMLGNSGWGYFAGLIFILILLVPKVNIKDNYFDYFWAGFFLIAFAACFARGDELRVDLYDSGNRVLLQIVPFIIYGFTFRFIKAFGKNTD